MKQDKKIIEFVIRDSAGTIMMNGEYNTRNIYYGLKDGLEKEGYEIPDSGTFLVLILEGMADRMVN